MNEAPRRSPLNSPIARGAIAAVIVGALIVGTLVVRFRSSTDASTPISTAGHDASSSATEEAGIGALDDHRPLVGQAAPDFALRRGDGSIVKLSDLRGNVVWVNFWASWCVPCKKELPDIQKLYDEKHADGFEVLAVNWKDDRETAQRFFDSRSLSLPLLFDPAGKVYDQYRLQGLPDSFFIDRDGKIAALQFGFLTEDKMRQRLKTAGLP